MLTTVFTRETKMTSPHESLCVFSCCVPQFSHEKLKWILHMSVTYFFQIKYLFLNWIYTNFNFPQWEFQNGKPLKFGFPQWEFVQFCFPILKVFRELVVNHFPTSGNPLNFLGFFVQIIGKMGKWECYRTRWSQRHNKCDECCLMTVNIYL